MCGEKMCQTIAKRRGMGSPPRVRGKGFFNLAHEVFEGITPACAGKSTFSLLFWNVPRDHPRVCGEKFFRLILLTH